MYLMRRKDRRIDAFFPMGLATVQVVGCFLSRLRFHMAIFKGD